MNFWVPFRRYLNIAQCLDWTNPDGTGIKMQNEIMNITSKSILLQEINSLYSIIEILLQNLKAHYGNFSTQKYFKHYLLSFS